MKMICTRLVLCAILLQGCQSSLKPPQTQTQTSASVAIAPSLRPAQAPEEIVASLNRLYNDDQQNDCREIGTHLPRGHYYCSGILIRATSDGDYLPWTHSPSSIARGSASFSWIRADVQTSMMLTPSGFILRNATEGHRLGLPGYDEGFICLYPFDASTAALMLHKGCGHRKNTVQATYPQPEASHHNALYAWGSCEDIGITTLAAWMEYTLLHNPAPPTRPVDPTVYICAWNADSQSGWNNAIAAHRLFPDYAFLWNELMMTTVDDGYGLKDYISAIFYDTTYGDNGIEPARNFQRKAYENGNYLPIVRLNFTAPAQERFSLRPEDQAIAQQ